MNPANVDKIGKIIIATTSAGIAYVVKKSIPVVKNAAKNAIKIISPKK